MRKILGEALLLCTCVVFSAGGCSVDSGSEGASAETSRELQGAASEADAVQAAILLDVPLIQQNPELPRGCEVTSLAMLLNYVGVDVSKMTLAARIDKVPYKENGFFGNPNDGFVGDMYDGAKDGYGAYHAPVKRLADAYIANRVVDLTGRGFDALLTDYVGKGRPVWIISNEFFRPLDDSAFTTWRTRTGNVRITWHEHSVVITGFDANYVYINDPLDLAGKNKRLPRQAFRGAWEQMGSQAISYKASAADCSVRSNGRLYCNNKGGAALYASTTATSNVVDTVRTTYSWFDCWGTGDRHAGGNTTWYHTLGDDNGNWGWTPAVNLSTTSEFDADPSAQGLRRCQP
ncbi:C39 family peptidase [Pendulispora albinea]|uniref:C39 family peptidase n=1 Tax=Pendulispora albinea TaxID=2741071 RepID=A0ABZ2LYI6_9BACT